MVTDEAFQPERVQPTTRAAVAADDDLSAFVAEHYDRLLRLARMVCDDVTDTTDAVQAAMEQAWRHRDALRDGERRKAWLDRIVVREAIRVSRRRRTWLSRILGLGTEVDDALGLDDPSPAVVLRDALDTAFRRLPADQRAVVALHLQAGYTVAETAAIVDAPVETVRSRLRVARERLRRALEDPHP